MQPSSLHLGRSTVSRLIGYLLIGLVWLAWELSRPALKQPVLLHTFVGKLAIVLLWPVRVLILYT